jgi:hypothetical protein
MLFLLCLTYALAARGQNAFREAKCIPPLVGLLTAKNASDSYIIAAVRAIEALIANNGLQLPSDT